MKKHYEEKYHEEVHGNLLKKDRYYLFRAKLSKKIYWKYLKGRVLEFGCGLGQNIFLEKESSMGVDISEFCIRECEKRGIKVFKDIKKVKEKFDGVLCVHVLEHMNNPDQVLKDFHKVLKDNGILVLVLPEPVKNKEENDFEPNIAKHLFAWNFNSINELLTENKFKVLLNKFNYGYGYSKFYKYSFGEFLVKLAGKIRRKREMIIVARKL